MRISTFRILSGGLVVCAMALLLNSPPMSYASPNRQATPNATASIQWTVFATGLDSPRGLRFGPDGMLYVAESGTGGTASTTAADCQQVPDPIGPYTGGMTGEISKISPDGKRTIIADKLPSNSTTVKSGSLTTSVADILFVNDTLYALISGAGCS